MSSNLKLKLNGLQFLFAILELKITAQVAMPIMLLLQLILLVITTEMIVSSATMRDRNGLTTLFTRKVRTQHLAIVATKKIEKVR